MGMIIKKPYAFLIKNFKKIHIFLLIISLFIYFKNTQLYNYVKEFISYGSYDIYNDPISRYVNFFVMLCLILLLVGSVGIIHLLKKKEKPWKLYLLPVIQYAVLFVTFTVIGNFFHRYTGVESTATLRIWKDVLLVSQIFQFGVFGVFLLRIFGIDLKRFNFKLDEEYLDLEQSDIDEFEITFNFDKASIKRFYRRMLRHFGYFYGEHKFLCRLVIFVVAVVTVKSSYDFIISYKSVEQGANLNTSNAYTVKVNNSYYSDKSYNGNVITKKSAFVIIDLDVTNNVQERDIDLNKYHIINGISNYTTTFKTYETEFKDLGKTYEAVKLKRGETVHMIMIFKVDKNLRKDRFVFYYQEVGASSKKQRKVKLKLQDLSKIEEKESLQLGDILTVNVNNSEENIIFEDYSIAQSADFVTRICTTVECNNNRSSYKASLGYKVLSLNFASDTYEGKDMSEFVTDYGKIEYIDLEGNTKEIEIVDPIHKTYYGKHLFIRIPDEVAESTSIAFNFTVRNSKYVYKIR